MIGDYIAALDGWRKETVLQLPCGNPVDLPGGGRKCGQRRSDQTARV